MCLRDGKYAQRKIATPTSNPAPDAHEMTEPAAMGWFRTDWRALKAIRDASPKLIAITSMTEIKGKAAVRISFFLPLLELMSVSPFWKISSSIVLVTVPDANRPFWARSSPMELLLRGNLRHPGQLAQGPWMKSIG